jgi:hypothetical protein
MKKLLIVLALTALTLIALSPMLRAARSGSRPSTGSSYRSGSSSYRASTYHAPSYSPSYKASKPSYSSYKPAAGSYAARSYANVKGVKFKHGVYYAGKANNHWTKRTWNRTWGVWYFYCPVQAGWYYWCEAQSAYYPVSVIATYRPTEDVLPAPEQSGSQQG